jgi:ABC-2 type transport system ATP-binding protein
LSPPAVELIDVYKRFGDVEAMRGVSLTVEAGQVVAFLGPNGAGKTTSISVMLGLRRPSSGQARLFGLDPWSRAARSRIGVMLQDSGVPTYPKVREIIDLFRSYYPAPLATGQAIALAGLEEKADAKIDGLSGGQLRRLYFALSICGDPDVLFLDEPTVGMDVEARLAFWAGIKELIARGRTIVLTTHYLEEADQVANRVVVINQGVIVADATPAEIKAGVAGRRVSFRCDPPNLDLLQGLPVERVEVVEGSLRFLSREPEAVLKALFARGVAISDLEVVGADLEEAFLTLTHSNSPVAKSGNE